MDLGVGDKVGHVDLIDWIDGIDLIEMIDGDVVG